MRGFRLTKLPRLVEVMQIKGVRVFFHWSAILIGGIILLGVLETPWLTVVVLASYYGVILLHESGHMIAAQRINCDVWSIEVYPFWGITRFACPYSAADQCVIAWGGVLAQTLIAIPLVIWVELFGYTRYPPLNATLAIFGPFSCGVAAFNLLPVRPLDGAIAWRLLPALVGRARGRRNDARIRSGKGKLRTTPWR